jgi:hypothetical protein
MHHGREHAVKQRYSPHSWEVNKRKKKGQPMLEHLPLGPNLIKVSLPPNSTKLPVLLTHWPLGNIQNPNHSKYFLCAPNGIRIRSAIRRHLQMSFIFPLCFYFFCGTRVWIQGLVHLVIPLALLYIFENINSLDNYKNGKYFLNPHVSGAEPSSDYQRNLNRETHYPL